MHESLCRGNRDASLTEIDEYMLCWLANNFGKEEV